MAADQRKKRQNATNNVGCTSRELYRVKRKKVGLQQYNLNTRPSISLEWSDDKKSVVARREQIGICQRDIIPFTDTPRGQNILADVFDVPREIFDLENLTGVLSFEVWQTYLSENEKSFLSRLLPKGEEADVVVEELLSGTNFHFGNPFVQWCSSVKSGSFHPDAILQQEQFLKANKKEYYSELQNYHSNMIGNLQMWKERFASCENPENEIMQKMWRLRKHSQKRLHNYAIDSRPCDPEENLAGTSESGSWAADDKEKLYSSDPNTMLVGESERGRKGEKWHKQMIDGSKVAAKVEKAGKLHKNNIQCSDGTKYMSYIKVSKQQHQLVKSILKQSNYNMHPSSINNLLGSLDTLQVQPFEKFEEEEQEKIHEHWLQVVRISLPAGFANWKRLQSQKHRTLALLGQEIEEKLNFVDEEEENSKSLDVIEEDLGSGGASLGDHALTEDVEEEKCDSVLQEQISDETIDHESTATSEDEGDKPSVLPERTKSEETSRDEDEEPVSASTQNPFLQQVGSLGGSHKFHPVGMESDGDNTIGITSNGTSSLQEYMEKENQLSLPSSEAKNISSGSDVNAWPGVGMSVSYFHSNSMTNEYSSANNLSLGNHQVVDRQSTVGLINLESSVSEKERGNDLLHGQNNNVPFLNPYPSQERNELFQPFLKDQGNNPPYQHEQKQAGLEFQPATNLVMEANQYPEHYRNQLYSSMPLEPRQKRPDNLYMHQNVDEPIFSGGVRYSIPRGEQFSPVDNVQDWDANSLRMPVLPTQSHVNSGEFLCQSWFSVDHRPRSKWAHSEGAGPCQGIENGSSADQSLFSVISECNQLRSRGPYNAMAVNERIVPTGNFGFMGGGMSSANTMLQQTAHGLDYLTGHESMDGMKANGIGWMGLPHHGAAAFQDPMSKTFLSSWNR